MVDGEVQASVTFAIRPEDLTRAEPSLQTVTPTFDGAFIDDYGAGVSAISIAGNTGWNVGAGWEANFQNLRSTVWTAWRQARLDAVSAGRSPDTVQLVFADTLDDIVGVVAPGAFTLKRNKANPLLMQYAIAMSLVSETLGPTDDGDDLNLNAQTNPDAVPAGLDSLDASIAGLGAAPEGINSALSQDLSRPACAFVSTASLGLDQVRTTATGGDLLGQDDLVGLTGDLSEAGRNAFQMLGPAATDDGGAMTLAGVASTFENAMCLCRNVFSPGLSVIDTSGIYGASNCSSTVGGSPLSPLAGSNPFEVFQPLASNNIAASVDAQASISALRLADPVSSPMAASDVVQHLATIATGISFG